MIERCKLGDRPRIEEMEERITFQEVCQKKEVAIVELEKEAAGLVEVFFRKSTFKHVFRQT